MLLDVLSPDEATLLRHVQHASHILPAQGPITVFVHHNTLHAFQKHPFDEGVRLGGEVYGCRPYLEETRYRAEMASGRIPPEYVDRVLLEELGDAADEPIAGLGTRIELRRASLHCGVDLGTGDELRWLLAETASSLEGLWDACQSNAERFVRSRPQSPTIRVARHRDVLLASTGEDTDRLVHDTLIPFCGAFLDQGVAQWTLPRREEGFLQSFAHAFAFAGFGSPFWRRPLPDLLRPLRGRAGAALPSILESLQKLGVPKERWENFVLESLLALRGWAGMAWQCESNADWLLQPAPSGTLVEFLCVRLLLDRCAIVHVARTRLGPGADPKDLQTLVQTPDPDARAERLAYSAFRLSQHLGWPQQKLCELDEEGWTALLAEIEGFPDLDRRRILHHAFERSYFDKALSAVESHAQSLGPARVAKNDPSFQIACCIDDREESFRRYIEELDPTCETFGIAGFFGVAMYYRGVTEAHFRPLCPVVVTPSHSVIEAPAYSFVESSRLRQSGQRRIGKLAHRLHLETRTLWGGLLTALGGAVAAIPLVARILFPRSVAELRRLFGRLGEPVRTELRLEREEPKPPDAPRPVGYTLGEMADIVEGGLRSMGLTPEHGISPVVIICGHGSSSLNNPHEAAYDCGACGGGRGGPNARAFAQMANDPRVRRLLRERDLVIPDEVSFVGAYHNTCDDSVTWYDLDDLPRRNRPRFERAREIIDGARRRNAHERCRRFESAPLSMDDATALRHVEARSEDLSQTRPEYGHTTNAMCLVGRRDWSRGLFLDRRAFLTSYDPTQDDDDGTILERLLRAVVPVCAGINLEYYFSHVDPAGYGCSTKLPHNLACLLGVMDGARSDLRTGLNWQMVEIHEAVRLQFVIETTPQILERIMNDNPEVAEIIRGEWVRLALLDPEEHVILRYRKGGYERQPAPAPLPRVRTSLEWYRGQRGHLGFASIVAKES